MTTAETQRPDGPGHVFVVLGDLAALAHDSVAVPTDRRFVVTQGWSAVVGGSPVRPDGWGSDGRRVGSSRERVWFVDVGRGAGDDVSWLADGVRQVLHAMAGDGVRPPSRPGAVSRSRPLLALPVVGIGDGGFTGRRGEVLEALLGAAREVAAARGVDVALVTRDPAVHGALQHLRREAPQAAWGGLDESSARRAAALGRTARDGGLALFLGAGVSVPAGLPTWSALMEGLRARTAISEADFRRLGPLDQAHLLAEDLDDFSEQVVSACRSDRHAIGHALLAALDCEQVVTTNFDQCYEGARAAVSRQGGPVTTVLPWDEPVGGVPWLLKMHGDIDRPGSIVLSRRHFVRYDAESRPAASVLQSLLLTRHLLVIGASVTDDNVLRLAHEVAAFHEDRKIERSYGTVLDVEGDETRGRLWTGRFTWCRMPGAEVADRARAVEVFLDRVAAEATTDASWLLDQRFDALLPRRQRELASELRAVAHECRGLGEPWAALVRELNARGARSGRPPVG